MICPQNNKICSSNVIAITFNYRVSILTYVNRYLGDIICIGCATEEILFSIMTYWSEILIR